VVVAKDKKRPPPPLLPTYHSKQKKRQDLFLLLLSDGQTLVLMGSLTTRACEKPDTKEFAVENEEGLAPEETGVTEGPPRSDCRELGRDRGYTVVVTGLTCIIE
jgi:hypothetical protein